MSLIVVGLNHRSAPLDLLERVAVASDDVASLDREAVAAEHVGEAVVLATCNRVEVYATVSRFHGGVGALSGLLAKHSGIPVDELAPSLYVHYDDTAVRHLYEVVTGLDSMVVGETQILGQVRLALRTAQEQGSVGGQLDGLLQEALRVGKRAHTETGIDRSGSAVVTAGIARVASHVGGVHGRPALVVGAGSMGALVAGALLREGVATLTIANRSLGAAQRLAERLGEGASAVALADLDRVLPDADVVVSCTGAVGPVVSAAAIDAAATARDGRLQAYLDLALPRDVEHLDQLPAGVVVVTLEELGTELAAAGAGSDVDAVRAIVAAEVDTQIAARNASAVAPTVVALRQRADAVVAAELSRLDARLPGLSGEVRDELERTVRRTVDKLLHAPTVRIKELAADGEGQPYAQALSALFDLEIDASTGVVDVLAATEDQP